MPPFEYEEKVINGTGSNVRDQLRQAVMEGWMPYYQEGSIRPGCGNVDQIMVRLVRAKQPALRRRGALLLIDDEDRPDRVA